MGTTVTRVVPSYASLFMAKLEEDLLAWTSARPHTWWRYIDDIFAIWEHGREALNTFLDQINSFHPSIKFTAETSTQQVSFLDTTVILEDTCTPSPQIHINTYPQTAVIQNTAPPLSSVARPLDSEESAQRGKTSRTERTSIGSRLSGNNDRSRRHQYCLAWRPCSPTQEDKQPEEHHW